MSINFDRAADYYDETRGYPPEVARAVGAALAELAGATPETRFLEIGIGTGRIALPLLALGHDYTGVDISVRMMERLREKLPALEAETGRPARLTLLTADMQALPFPDAAFDAVIAAHVFHLVADPALALWEALRVLRPAGALLICGDSMSGHEPTSINEAWRGIVRAAYGPIPNANEATDRLLREALEAQPDLRMEELRPVHWAYALTVAQELEAIRLRRWSNTWLLPDALFARCLADLEIWCREHYADQLDVPRPREAALVVRRLRRERPA